MAEGKISRVGESRTEIPEISLITSLLYGAGSLIMTMSALFRSHNQSPQWLLIVFAILGGSAAIAVLAARDKFTPQLACVLVLASEVSIVALSMTTHSSTGLVANAAVYTVLGIYMMWFLPRAAARKLLTLGLGSYLAVVVIRDFDGVLTLAVALSFQALIASCVVLYLHEKLERVADTDVLTGAGNRRAIEKATRKHIDRYVKHGIQVSMLCIDVDGLKNINDRNGHEAGDRVLQSLTHQWRGRLRERDVLARIGGDEFVVLLPCCTRAHTPIVERKLRKGQLHNWSAGFTTVQAYDTFESMLARADYMLYEQKAERRLMSKGIG